MLPVGPGDYYKTLIGHSHFIFYRFVRLNLKWAIIL